LYIRSIATYLSSGEKSDSPLSAAKPKLSLVCRSQVESGSCGQLRQQYAQLLREKEECRRLLEDLMRENVLKTRECREAQESLRELQMELMRKSMHVGSLGDILCRCGCSVFDCSSNPSIVPLH
jgi:kinesin family protein C2/C3